MHTIYPDICQDKASIDEVDWFTQSIDEVTEHLMVRPHAIRANKRLTLGGRLEIKDGSCHLVAVMASSNW